MCREARILVAYDASEPAERAFRFALELAMRDQATLGILAFANPSWPPTAVEMAGFLESTAQRLERAVAGLREAAQACGVPLSARLITGRPVRQIIREAVEQRADLIVVGQRRRSRIQQWLLRSVSERLSNEASCKVTIVK